MSSIGFSHHNHELALDVNNLIHFGSSHKIYVLEALIMNLAFPFFCEMILHLPPIEDSISIPTPKDNLTNIQGNYFISYLMNIHLSYGELEGTMLGDLQLNIFLNLTKKIRIWMRLSL